LVAEDSSSEYWQLTDSKGRTGWILKQYVSLTPVFGGQTGELQQQLQQQQSLVSQLQQEKISYNNNSMKPTPQCNKQKKPQQRRSKPLPC